MDILIIGCGRTGKAIVENLNGFKYVDRIFLYSRTSKSVTSLVHELHSKKLQAVNNIKSIHPEYTIITLSGMSDSAREESVLTRKTTYEVRQDELKFNLGAIAYLASDLKRLNSKIIVITNPVDEITNYLKIKLDRKDIIGFGMELDAKRYEKFLGRKVMCMGMHGRAIPIIGAKTEEEYDTLLQKVDNELLEYTRKYGIPHKMAGSNFNEFFSKLNGKKKEVIHLSYYLEKPFLGIKDICISLPYNVREGKILGVADMKVNNIEKKRFMDSASELQKSIHRILEAHDKLTQYR